MNCCMYKCNLFNWKVDNLNNNKWVEINRVIKHDFSIWKRLNFYFEVNMPLQKVDQSVKLVDTLKIQMVQQHHVQYLGNFPTISWTSQMFKCQDNRKLMMLLTTSRSINGMMSTLETLQLNKLNQSNLRSTNWSTWLVALVSCSIPNQQTIKKGYLLLALLVLKKYKVKKCLLD